MAENNNNIYDPNFLDTLESGTGDATTGSAEYTTAIEKVRKSIESAKASQEFIGSLSANAGGEWPQNTNSANLSTGGGGRGFLPPVLISPSLQTTSPGQATTINNGSYTYTDWRGQQLNLPKNSIKTEDRFKLSLQLPKSNTSLVEKPYSMRDIPLVFNDYRYDYFKHGLQVLDNLNPIENPENGASNARLSNFTTTPFENNDPVMFGFEIIIDAVSSPLLNGSVLDFINNYSSINEVASRKQVYEDFKQQFIKFFRTKGTVRITDLQIPTLSKMNVNSANQDPQVNLFWPGKKAYLGYYIKKVTGLDFLVESNKGDTMKYFANYKNDMITLDFFEDVSLSLGTLANLYKLLYWSKPNGKNIIPENLLRFNCDIVISECRNFQRTRKASEAGNLEIIKDNLSRHIYSLRECQFYFDKPVHNNDIDIGGQGPQIYETYNLSFDFKYVTNRFERFVPSGNFGQYVGYNAGAIWKIGNAGERENRGMTSGGLPTDSSVPKFFTVGNNSLNENGVTSPVITKIVGSSPVNNSNANFGEGANQSESLEDAKQTSEKNSKVISDQNKTNEIANAQGSGKGSTLDLGLKSAEDAVNKAKDLGKASVADQKNKLLDDSLSKFKDTAKTAGNNIMKNLQQRAENAALNARNQVISRARIETQKMLNNSINQAKQSIQNGVGTFVRENLLNQTLNKVKSGPSPQPQGKPNPPNSTEFFDVKGQLLNFAGPNLGGLLGGQ